MQEIQKEIGDLITTWDLDPLKVKSSFVAIYDFLLKQDKIHFSWKARPNISYSLRAHKGDTDSFFVLIDIIDEEERWLSACFPAKLITDPEEKGDFIPNGMLGQDAICFDIDKELDTQELEYIIMRISEGYKNS